ncbi:MAG: 4-hydroxybenzoate octaprenyltransferase [Burkholderiales bacterium]|nr:4-hydroxybenzoate octaprenyltransferase [Burkholderiales bacterium]
MFKNYLQLIRFNKPIGSLLLLWPTLIAVVVAANGEFNLKLLLVFSCGVFLTRSAGCAFNDIWDVEFDQQVTRTKSRPLANGSLNRKQALIFAIILSVLALVLELVFLHFKTILLSLIAVFIFITYPLMKRFFAIPQAYLGIAFSFGILMAFMEINNTINVVALLLFAANFFWVIAYDTIYALCDIEDDLKIGIKTSAIFWGKSVNTMVAFCFLCYLLLMLSVGIILQLNYFFYSGIAIALILILYQIVNLFKHNQHLYFKLFLLNNYVGLIVFSAICLGLQWK